MKDFSNEAYYLLFSVLANRTRLAIIDVLRDGPKRVSEISAKLKQEQALVSANLEQLEKCVFIISEGSGKDRLYSLNREVVEPLSQVLEFHVAKHCPGLTKCIPQKKLGEYMKKEAEKETFIRH